MKSSEIHVSNLSTHIFLLTIFTLIKIKYYKLLTTNYIKEQIIIEKALFRIIINKYLISISLVFFNTLYLFVCNIFLLILLDFIIIQKQFYE